jgi:dTDP-4-amino-4,6-dideoxygalactose transaminase
LGHKEGDYPVAEEAYERLISLPMFHSMAETDVKDVCQALRKVIAQYVK